MASSPLSLMRKVSASEEQPPGHHQASLQLLRLAIAGPCPVAPSFAAREVPVRGAGHEIELRGHTRGDPANAWPVHLPVPL